MAENPLQFQWIVTIKEGLDHLFAGDPNVYVAGDMFWYPVEGNPKICAAPDAMVVFGRPKGYRGCYRQWEDDGIPPQVVFEILSPGNRFPEMLKKFNFYRQYGVEEYYLYDPEPQSPELSGFVRRGDDLVEIAQMNGHVSPRLGIRFEMGDDGLRVIAPDGKPLRSYAEVARQADEATQRADEATQRAEKLERELEHVRKLLAQQRPGSEVQDV